MDTLAAFLDRLAADRPAAPALVDRDQPVSYAALADESARLAAGLASLGIGAGDRVALWLPNLPAWLATFFACGRLGAIAVSVNTRFRSHEVADIVGRAGCKATVFWPGFRNIDFAGIRAGCDAAALAPLERVIVYDESDGLLPDRVLAKPVVAYRALAAGAPLAAGAGGEDSGCVIFTTSGTTRAPKFVLHDQRTVVRHADDVARVRLRSAGHRRPRHRAALWRVRLHQRDGRARRRPATRDVPHLRRKRVGASRPPAPRDAHSRERRDDRPDARGGARRAGVPARAVLRLRRVRAGVRPVAARRGARGLKVVGLYGMSECHALMARQDESLPLPARVLAGGRPVAPEARVRARDPESGAIQPHGVAGELEIKAPSVMVDYGGDARGVHRRRVPAHR
jgi:fatty-acyl-CoA synthase